MEYVRINRMKDVMPQEDYSKLVASILALSYQQRLSLKDVLDESLQASEFITGVTPDEIRSKLNKGLASINAGRVVSADVVNKRLHEKYGI